MFQIEATGGVLRNAQDQLTIDIIEKLNSNKISLETAIKVLNVSQRSIFRNVAGFTKFSVSYFNHGNKNRSPKNKIKSEVILNSKKLMKEKYFDFN